MNENEKTYGDQLYQQLLCACESLHASPEYLKEFLQMLLALFSDTQKEKSALISDEVMSELLASPERLSQLFEDYIRYTKSQPAASAGRLQS